MQWPTQVDQHFIENTAVYTTLASRLWLCVTGISHADLRPQSRKQERKE